MIYLGLSLVAVCVLFLFAAIIRRLSLNQKQWIIFSAIFIFGLMVIAFNIKPPYSWDLTRHYQLIRNMQSGGAYYVFTKSDYKHLPVINLLYAVIAFLGMPQLLPAITTAICYGILTYLLFDLAKKERLDSRIIAGIVIFNFALCPFLHLVSGIRNVLAFAVFALAVYNEFYNKKTLSSWVIYIATVFIHPSALIILAIRVIFILFKKWQWIGFIVILWSFAANIIVNILTKIPNDFLVSVGHKLQDYLGNREFSGYKILLVKLVFILSFYIVIEITKQQNIEEMKPQTRTFLLFLQLTILVAAGAFRAVFIADRLTFFVAFLAVPAIVYIYKNFKGRLRYVFIVESALIIPLLFAHQVLYFSAN